MVNVNAIVMENVSHAQAVAALKRAGKRVELTVKRKAVVKVFMILKISHFIDRILMEYIDSIRSLECSLRFFSTCFIKIRSRK